MRRRRHRTDVLYTLKRHHVSTGILLQVDFFFEVNLIFLLQQSEKQSDNESS